MLFSSGGGAALVTGKLAIGVVGRERWENKFSVE